MITIRIRKDETAAEIIILSLISLSVPLGFLVFWLGLGIILFITGLRGVFFRRMIENIPTSKMRSIAMGLVEVYGEAVPIKVIKSPLLRRNCVYHKSEIKKYCGKWAGWITLKEEEKSEPFLLRDDTGRVLVDCKGANLNINRYVYESGIGDRAPPQILSYLKSNKIRHGNTLRWSEYLIRPKEKIYVLGTAAEAPDVKSGLTSSERIVLKKGRNDRIFYVSNKSEKKILSSVNWKIISSLLGGMLLIVGWLAHILRAYFS